MFKIITDTACDFLMDYAASVDVTLIPLYKHLTVKLITKTELSFQLMNSTDA